jgi:hypothetical protein
VVQDPNWINPAPALASVEASAAAAAGVPRLTPHRKAFYKERSPTELSGDVAKLADQQYNLSGRLRRERDDADKKLLDAESKLRFAKGWIWVLGLAIVGSWGVTVSVLKLWLLPLLEKVPR